MTAGDWFGGLDLGAKYGIGLGALFFIVVLFAGLKLYLQRRKISKIKARGSDQEKTIEQTSLTAPPVEQEGDLFGIRALEKGFTGGVPQSNSATPTLGSTSTIYSPGRIPYGNDRGAPGGNISTLEFGPNTTSLSSAGAPDHAVDMDLEVPPSPGFPLPSAVTLPSPATKAPQSHHAPSIIDYDLFAQGAQGTISNPSIVISRDYAQLPAPSLSAVRYGTLGFENYQDPQFNTEGGVRQTRIRSSAASLGDVYDSYYQRQSRGLQISFPPMREGDETVPEPAQYAYVNKPPSNGAQYGRRELE